MGRRSIYKSPAELAHMVAAGNLTAAALCAVKEACRPGVTTLELDRVAERTIRDGGGIPNFALVPGYRHTICASINSDVVHGIPSERVLVPGDIVSVDCGALVDGWNGDAAFTVVLDDPSCPEVVAERQRLSRVTEESLWRGIACLATARYVNEIGAAIEDYVCAESTFGILADYVGHGVGRSMHEEPPVFNTRVSGRSPKVQPGLVVAIEPMLVVGSGETFVRDDGWAVASVDGTPGAHWEHTVAVHDAGIWVLTSEDGGKQRLAPFGIVPVPIV